MKNFVPLFVFLFLALGLTVALFAPKAQKPRPVVEMPAITLTALSGKGTLQLDRMHGEVVFVNFFASWCTPCLAEFPELQALKKEFPGVKFYGIVWNDTAKALKPFFRKHGNPYDALWLDENGRASVALGIHGIPESYIVGRDGRVRYHLDGPIEPGMREDILAPLLTELEAEHAP